MRNLLLTIAFIFISFISLDARVNITESLPTIEDTYMDQVLQQHVLVTSGTMDRDFLLTNFLIENQDKFKTVDLMSIKQRLDKMSDSELLLLNRTNFKDPFVSVLLSVAVGELGIDRFYIGDTGLGVLKLITAGGLGIWWLVDLFIISNKTKENNVENFNKTVMLQEGLTE